MSRFVTTDWWGFRLRSPDTLALKPAARNEYISFGLVIAVAFNLLWVATVVIFPLAPAFVVLKFIRIGWGVPLVITAIPVLSMLLAPKSWLEFLTIGGWLQLAREQGSARRWDHIIGIVSILSLVGAIWRLSGFLLIAAIFLLACLIILIYGFLFFKKGQLWTLKKWKFDLPEWIKGRGKDNQGQKDIPLPQPDSDAKPIYDFSYGDKNFKLGILIDDQLVSRLRALNRNAGGHLYTEQAEAVILVDRAPAEGISQAELISFSSQLAAIVESLNLGKYETANLVLSFVQRAIPYAKDKDSTAGFEGGPFSEYGRFALETINDSAGDCECTSILCCSLLAYMGIDTAFMLFEINDPDTGDKSYHAAVGLDINSLILPPEPELELFELRDNKGTLQARYLYGESAADREISFGVVPDEWKKHISLQKVVPIPRPTIISSGE